MSNVWQQNTNQQNADQQGRPESMAFISKATRELMDTDRKVRDMGFKMLAEAKKIGEDIKEHNLTTKGKTKDGREMTNKFIVYIRPVYFFYTPEGRMITTEALTHKDAYGNKVPNELLKHKDGTQMWAPTIYHCIGTTALTIRASEKMDDRVYLLSIKAEKFDRPNNKMIVGRNNDIMENRAFNYPARLVAGRILEAGFLQKPDYQKREDFSQIPEEQKTPAIRFAEYARDKIAEIGSQITLENGTTRMNAYVGYTPATERYGEVVKLRSNTEKDIVIELSVKDDRAVARAVNFAVKDENGKFACFYINKAEDLNRLELQTVPEEIKTIAAEFKGF